MAIIRSIIFTGASQKIGEVVLQKWKDETIARKKPSHVSNPKTQKQEFQRARVKIYNLLYQRSPFELKAGFKEISKKITEWNSFFRENTKSQFLSNTNEYVFSNYITAKGSLKETPLKTLSITGSDLKIEWDTTAVENQKATDYLIAISYEYDSTNKKIVQSITDLNTVTRADGSKTLTFKTTPTTGNVAWVFWSFSSADNKKQSNNEVNNVNIT
ncbi:MAG: DUF6266 family protein [Marinisporobacter sp.]|nr:DUF6266 family protein [Marinisporobacter sp.]